MVAERSADPNSAGSDQYFDAIGERSTLLCLEIETLAQRSGLHSTEVSAHRVR